MAAIFTELDFLQIKENLKQFLKSQNQFKDYNFDGSGLNVLVELLAYNDSALAFYLNMVANDSFLDSAVLRESIVSRAKAIGYVPHSSRAPKATIQVDFNPSLGGGPLNPASILIPQWTKFTTNVDNKVYVFMNPVALTVTNNGAGHYIGNLDIIEGVLLSYQFIVDDSLEENQRYVLPNLGIDTTSLVVKVQESANIPSVQSFSLASDINVINGDTPVYFFQEVDDGKIEIFFGDGVLGKRVVNGNIINIDYVLTNGEKANGARRFVPTATLSGYNGTVYTTLQTAKGGLEKEDDESVKFLAPKFYEAQNRAVNKHDYETLIQKDYPQVEFVRVWGGEENDPQVFGKVFIALKPKGALAFSEQEKLSILNSIIRPRSPVSIESVIIEPEYLKVIVDSSVKIKSKHTTLTLGDIQDEIIQAIKDYRDSNLIGFDSDFRYSKLTKAIDEADPSVQNNLTTVHFKTTITPPLNLPTRYEINTNAKVSKGDASNNVSALNSTGFIKDGLVPYIGDNGMGELYIYRVVLSQKVIVEHDIGTLDYDLGKIVIPSLTIEGIADGSENIDFILAPAENDLNPIRNQIILILDEDISVSITDEDA